MEARSRRWARWIVGFAAFFVTFAVTALVIGLHDVALADSDLGVTVTSVVLLATAGVSFVAAYQLAVLSRADRWERNERPACKPPVLIALTLTLLIGLYVLLSGIR